jgi:predicted acylesterase/phospholipase RssA
MRVPFVKTHIFILLLSVFLQEHLYAQETAQYPRIGIALSGGGMRGIAHIGVLRRLEEEGIRPYMISGSSMGALIGSLYCLGYDTYEIEKIIKEAETKEVFSNKPDRSYTENYLKKTSDRTVIELELTEEGIHLPNALNNGHRILQKLRKYMLVSEYFSTDFDSLKYRMRVVCSDIQSAGKVVFKDGDLPVIILGSMAFPGLFKPVIYNDMRLLDGGLTDNIPTGVLENCDYIFTSDTTHDTPSMNKDYNFIELLDRISVMMTKTNTDQSLKNSDIIFRPVIEDISLTELENPDSLINAGYEAADRKIEEIRTLINFNKYSAADKSDLDINIIEVSGNNIYKKDEILSELSGIRCTETAITKIQEKYRKNGYILCSAEMVKGSEKDTLKIYEGMLKAIDIKGDYATRKSYIRQELDISKNRILRLKDIESSIDNLYGTGLFSKVNYELDFENEKIIIIVEEQPYHLLRIGANYQTDRGFLGLFEFSNKNLHGKRAEIYGGLTYGEKFNRIEFSYYNPFLRKSSVFYEFLPYYQEKEKEYFDTDHERIDEQTSKEKRAGALLNLGFQVFDNYQGTVSILQEYIDHQKEYSNRTSGLFRILADSRDDQIIPTRGVYISWNLETGMYYDYETNVKFQKTWGEFTFCNNIMNRLNYEIGVSGGTGDKTTPALERYFSGGIRTMPGTFYEEYSVIQYIRFRLRENLLVYRATLFDTYITGGYYLNGMWTEKLDEIEWNSRDFVNSFYLGLTMNSSFGPVEAGWGVTAGNGIIKKTNRLFLSFGYPLQ